MHDLAQRALTQRSPQLLREGLVAGLNDPAAEWWRDHRDLMMWLAPLHDAARRLGLDVVEEFDAAAEAGPEDLRELVQGFGRRTDVDERSFGYRLEP